MQGEPGGFNVKGRVAVYCIAFLQSSPNPRSGHDDKHHEHDDQNVFSDTALSSFTCSWQEHEQFHTFQTQLSFATN